MEGMAVMEDVIFGLINLHKLPRDTPLGRFYCFIHIL